MMRTMTYGLSEVGDKVSHPDHVSFSETKYMKTPRVWVWIFVLFY